MRLFVAGATGVLGRALVPRLIEAGHAVTAMTRSEERAEELRSAGVDAVVCDVYDTAALDDAVERARPDVVVHELTALPQAIDPRKMGTQLAANDRIRVEGTRNLVHAAVRAGVPRIVAQSVAFAYAPEGGPVLDESAPLWLAAPRPWGRSVEAVAELERQVTRTDGLAGTVLRYGYFYGPGSAFAPDGSLAELVRKRMYPIAGGGGGVYSFVHVDDAASATLVAIERGGAATYNVVDDEPAAVRDWLPAYAASLGARAPRRVPGWLARIVAGTYVQYVSTLQRGASNAKIARELGWSPSIGSWRTGFG